MSLSSIDSVFFHAESSYGVGLNTPPISQRESQARIESAAPSVSATEELAHNYPFNAPQEDIKLKLTESDGSTYEGFMRGGMKNGLGTLRYANGDCYTGNFKDGKRSGLGELRMVGEQKDGTYYWYRGYWLDGLQHYRLGILEKETVNVRGKTLITMIYRGNWERGRMTGQGTYYYSDDGDAGPRYVGQLLDGKPHGEGTRYYSHNALLNVYQGSWHDGLRSGNGKMTFANGDVYEGAWKNDQPNGHGEMQYQDGTSYEGAWLDGKRVGQGILTLANGMISQGVWVDDKLSASHHQKACGGCEIC